MIAGMVNEMIKIYIRCVVEFMDPMKKIRRASRRNTAITLGIGIIIAAGMLAACNAPSEPTSRPTENVSSGTEEIAPTQVAVTSTQSPATIAIYQYPDSDSDKLGEYALPVLEALAESENLQIKVLDEILPPALNPGVQIVVLIGVPPSAPDLVNTYPDIQFLLMGETDIAPGANVSTIGADGLPRHEQAFLAGYISALIASEWRVGKMMTESEPSELADTFRRGTKFYCGLCRQAFPPFSDYPVIEIVENGGSGQGFQDLAGFSVDTVYVSEGVLGLAEGIEEGEALSIKVIGGAPPLGDRGSNWVVTIQFDLESPIKSVWSDLMDGNGGMDLPISFVLTDINDQLLSPGKFDHANQVISDVVEGFIGVEEIP